MKEILFLLSFFSNFCAYSQNENRSVFRQNPEHTGVYSSKNLGSFDHLQWKFKTDGKIFGSPAICVGVAYIGSEDKNLYAIRITDKKLIWKYSTNGAIYSTPAVYHNVVYFGSYDGNFYAVNAVSGKLKWKFKTNGEKKVGAKGLWTMKPATEYMEDPFDFFLSSPVLDEKVGAVYFGSGDSNIYALNLNDGSMIWTFGTGGIVHTSPALYKGKLYLGSWDQYFYAIDTRTGNEVWKFKTGSDSAFHLLEGIQSSATINDGKVFFGSRDGYYYGLETETGKLIWKYSAQNSWILTTAAIKNNTLYIGTSDTYQLVALDASTGKEKYHVQANGYIYSSPAIAGNTAFFGDFTGQLFAIDMRDNGKILDKYITNGRKRYAPYLLNKDKIDFAYLVPGMNLAYYDATVAGMNKLYLLGPLLSNPVLSGGNIYFGCGDSCLYKIKLKRDKRF